MSNNPQSNTLFAQMVSYYETTLYPLEKDPEPIQPKQTVFIPIKHHSTLAMMARLSNVSS